MKAAAILIGAGFVGKAHVDALRRLGIEVRGVLGSSPERSEEARAALSLPRAYVSIEEAAADNTASVAHVCTPNYLHFEQSSTLLRAGKHVLCEKPLATDTAESEILVRLA
ncbi:MAG TPA: Gfo/Idh/MocA family oxidoreductase [Candidatus Acidoferrum sp.]